MEVFGRQSFKREEELGWGGVHPSSACHLFDEMPSRYAVSEEEVLLVMSKEKVTREEALHLIHELRDAERRIDEKLDRLLEMFGVKLDGGINGAEEYNTFTEELTPTTEAVASPPPQESPSAPTKCSTVGLNIKGGTEQAMVVSLTNTCVSEGVPGSDAIVEAFSPRSFINSKLVTVMPTKCLIICEELSTGGEEDNVATNDWVEYTVATTRLTSMPTNFRNMWFNYTTISTKSVTALGSIHVTGYAPLPSRTAAVAVYKARVFSGPQPSPWPGPWLSQGRRGVAKFLPPWPSPNIWCGCLFSFGNSGELSQNHFKSFQMEQMGVIDNYGMNRFDKELGLCMIRLRACWNFWHLYFCCKQLSTEATIVHSRDQRIHWHAQCWTIPIPIWVQSNISDGLLKPKLLPGSVPSHVNVMAELKLLLEQWKLKAFSSWATKGQDFYSAISWGANWTELQQLLCRSECILQWNQLRQMYELLLQRELPKLGWSIIVQFKPIDLRPYTQYLGKENYWARATISYGSKYLLAVKRLWARLKEDYSVVPSWMNWNYVRRILWSLGCLLSSSATHLISVDWTISESCKSSCKITLEDGEIDEYLLYTKDQEFSYEQLIVHKEEFATVWVYQSASFIKSKGYSMTVTIAASTSFTNSIPVPLAGQVWKEFSWTLYCWNYGFVRKLQFCFVVFLISVKQAAAMDILDRNLEESDPTRLKTWPVHPKYVQRQCINQSDEICLSAPDLQIPWDPGGSH
uniref:Uncharacterized protein n=1 Tax=Oryza glumipatula TaxID=40148 RepID=A0A0E0BR41_9ORYZ